MSKTILILASNPRNTSRLRLDQEAREIQNSWRRGRYRDEYCLEQVWAVRTTEVCRAIMELKPYIVHFCGHGSGEDGLVLEDDSGNARLVSTTAIADLFRLYDSQVHCVILNACYSDVQAKAITEYVDYAIGTKNSIEDRLAIEFSVAFYDSLVNDLLVDDEKILRAYKHALVATELLGIPEHLKPVLTARLKVICPVCQERGTCHHFFSDGGGSDVLYREYEFKCWNRYCGYQDSQAFPLGSTIDGTITGEQEFKCPYCGQVEILPVGYN